MHFNPRVSVLKWNPFWQNCDVLSDNWSKWTLDYWSLHDFQHVYVLFFYYIWSILGSTLLGLGFGVLYFFLCLICFVQEFLDFCVFLVFNLIFSFGFVFFFAFGSNKDLGFRLWSNKKCWVKFGSRFKTLLVCHVFLLKVFWFKDMFEKYPLSLF
jgi:hypothetical protein